MRRITKKVRDEAALICAIGASNDDLCECYSAIASRLGIPAQDLFGDDAYRLALAAWDAAYVRGATTPGFEVDAEAEALLRTGWLP